MSEERTIEGTVAQFEAWLATHEQLEADDPAHEAEVLADLFARAARGGADLHDPTPDLISWLARDIARDDAAPADAYTDAASMFSHYLLFLRQHGLWRRSEWTVQQCWREIGVIAQRPVGMPSLGSMLDAAIAEGLAVRPDSADVLAVGVERGFVAPLRATLDAFADHDELSRPALAGLLGLAEDSAALELWQLGLRETELVVLEEDGSLTPSREVTNAGGCPPPSADLVQRVVRSLTRAAVLWAFDADGTDELYNVPRATGLLGALAASTSPDLYLPDDEDDSEDSTEDVVGLYVSMMLDDGDERAAALTAQVWDRVQALLRFGVFDETPLPEGAIALITPEPLRHALLRGLSDATGLTGTSDETAPWEPVELPTGRADTAVDLVISLEHDPQVWRRFRIDASQSVQFLHQVTQRAFGWRDVRSHLLCLADGTRRFAAPWMLQWLREEQDAQVVDGDAVAINSVLAAKGDELLYLYGDLRNPWRARVQVERVVTGVSDLVLWLDAGGDAPYEPTRIGEAVRPSLSEGMALPAELEHAWAFMELREFILTTDDGTEIAAPGPPEAKPGIVFSSRQNLADRLGEDSPALARLVQVAATPQDERIALWLDDDGATWAVALLPDGGASLIGSVVDLLRLAGVGYQSLGDDELGQPPQNQEAVDGIGEYRDWVASTFGVAVPDLWGRLGRDQFTEWLERNAGPTT